jgi:hypothetical protein
MSGKSEILVASILTRQVSSQGHTLNHTVRASSLAFSASRVLDRSSSLATEWLMGKSTNRARRKWATWLLRSKSAPSVRPSTRQCKPDPTDGLVTSLLAAHIADTRGRRMTLRMGALIFTIGGGFQTFCAGFTSMVVGRVISGFGVGMLSMVVPIYQVSQYSLLVGILCL